MQTVAAARDAYAALVEQVPNVRVMMLTAKMPPIHRKEVLDLIKAKLDLESPSPILLVATTCIQAGVNISFPVGYFEQMSIKSSRLEYSRSI